MVALAILGAVVAVVIFLRWNQRRTFRALVAQLGGRALSSNRMAVTYEGVECMVAWRVYLQKSVRCVERTVVAPLPLGTSVPNSANRSPALQALLASRGHGCELSTDRGALVLRETLVGGDEGLTPYDVEGSLSIVAQVARSAGPRTTP